VFVARVVTPDPGVVHCGLNRRCLRGVEVAFVSVMAGLVPAIHVVQPNKAKGLP